MLYTQIRTNKTLQILAFTLAEVLITLGIIGIVAAMTIPTILSNSQNMEFKSAYKKAYSDISRAFSVAILEKTLESRLSKTDTNARNSEWEALKSEMKVAKECASADLYSCWVNADRICTGACAGNRPQPPASSFVDASGRAWVAYSSNENIYLVDTNGNKGPNLFGKDRWAFGLFSGSTRVETGLPDNVRPARKEDSLSADSWCSVAPCNYYSWLYN